MNEYNERIATAKSNVRQSEKTESKLRSARRLLGEMQRKRDRLGKELAKEQADVDALEGLSITRMFHAIRGTKEQTHANVKAAIEDCQDQLESVREEMEALVNERRSLIETS